MLKKKPASELELAKPLEILRDSIDLLPSRVFSDSPACNHGNRGGLPLGVSPFHVGTGPKIHAGGLCSVPFCRSPFPSKLFHGQPAIASRLRLVVGAPVVACPPVARLLQVLSLQTVASVCEARKK